MRLSFVPYHLCSSILESAKYLVIIIWLKHLMFCFPLLQASLLLSKISPEIVGESLEANRFYDAVSCLMSYMVSTFFYSQLLLLNQFLMKQSMLNCKIVYFMENKTPWKGSNPLVSCLNIISNTEIKLLFSAVSPWFHFFMYLSFALIACMFLLEGPCLISLY